MKDALTTNALYFLMSNTVLPSDTSSKAHLLTQQLQ